ncbi:MAG: hypothetical protein PHG71_10180 [Kiritimatiellae bacterium]|nr:hypothetical protein [Kiritimatiellia bacterium]
MRLPLYDEVERLSAAVLDGTATPEEIKRFNAVLRDVPELAHLYFEQSRMHAMLECSGTAGAAGLRETAPGQAEAGDAAVNSGRRIGRRAARFVKLAAAAAALALAAAGLWLAAGDGRQATGDGRVAAAEKPAGPVEILHHWGSCNL